MGQLRRFTHSEQADENALASCKLEELKFEQKLGAGSFGLV